MLKTALVILTASSGGDVSLAVTTASNAKDCAAKAEGVTGTLAAAGITVLAHRCGETDLRFSPYGHGKSSGAARHDYRVTLPADPAAGFVIEPVVAGETCTAAPDADPAIICASSTQTILN